MDTKIEQPPMSLAEQKQVYDGEIIVNEALALSYEERGGMAAERAVVLRLMEAGWTPPDPLRAGPITVDTTEDGWLVTIPARPMNAGHTVLVQRFHQGGADYLYVTQDRDQCWRQVGLSYAVNVRDGEIVIAIGAPPYAVAAVLAVLGGPS